MSTTPARRFDTDLPDAKGYFGPYGGQLVPPVLKQAMDDIDAAFEKAMEINDRPVLLEFVTSPDSEVWPMVPAGVSNDDIVYARSVRPTTDPFAA